MPKAFSEAELNDTSNEFAQEANRTLGARRDPDYIGVTCDGEVCGRQILFYARICRILPIHLWHYVCSDIAVVNFEDAVKGSQSNDIVGYTTDRRRPLYKSAEPLSEV